MNLRERPFYLTDAQVAWVGDALSSMTLEEKVGQLFLVMGQDCAPETPRAANLEEGGAGACSTVIEVVLEKLAAGGPFTGTSPVDAFCGLPDTRM